MRAGIVFTLLIIALASTGLSAQSDAGYTAFLWTTGTNSTYEASGLQSDGGSTQIFYGPRGELLRVISTGFYTNDFFGLFQSYYTNEFIYQDRYSNALIEDYVALTNGYLERKEHSITTNYYSRDPSRTSGQSGSVAYRTTITGDGESSQTIWSNTNDWSPDFQRFLGETRDLDGHLLSWSLYFWTNDAPHSRQVTLTEYGSDDETHPSFIGTETKTFDSLGNVILATSETEGGGFVSSSTTSSTYVVAPGRKILSSTSLSVSTVNGTVTSSNVVSSRYEKGYLVEQDSKWFGSDGGYTTESLTHLSYDKFGNAIEQDYQEFGPGGSLQAETIMVSSYDQFGHLLNQETKFFDANGSLLQRSTLTDTYAPRGQAVDRPFAAQQFLDKIRAQNSSHFSHTLFN